MSGSSDEWEDLVRRLEATDSGVAEPDPDVAEPGPQASAPHGEAGTRPRGETPEEQRAEPPAAPRTPPRPVGPFDFKIDPASGHEPPGAAPGPRDFQTPDLDPFVSDFVPPEAEPLLVGRPDRVIAWIVAAGMPLLVLFLLIFARDAVPALLWPVMLVSTLASWVYLVWKLPSDREDDGDNGAQI